MKNGKKSFNEAEENINMNWFLVNILQHWKWFVASLLICLTLSYVYLKYSTKIYKVNAGIILKDDKKGGLGNSELSTFEEMGLLKTNNNVDNEIEMLKSRNLVEGVVRELKLYVSYFVSDNFQKTELYGDDNPYYPSIPIQVYMDPESAAQISGSIDLEISMSNDSSILVEGYYKNKNFSQVYSALPAVMNTPIGEIHLQPIEGYYNEKGKSGGYPNAPGIMRTPVGEAMLYPSESVKLNENYPLIIKIQNPLNIAKAYVSNLTVQLSNKSTSVVRFSLRETNRQRGEDFLARLIDLYNRDAMEDKNKASKKAADFIDERLSYINQDLSSSELDIENYKRDNKLTDIASESNLFLVEGNDYEKQLSDINIQLQLISYLKKELNNTSQNELMPGSLGISDPNLVSAVNEYNAAVLEKDRMLSYSSKSSPVVVRLDEKIKSMKEDIKSSVSGVEIALKERERSFARQNSHYDSQIGNIPKKERELAEKKRQQQIKETLYVMLLEKKEEAALSLAVTVPSAKIIESPLAENNPVAPKQMVVFLASFLVGIIIPTAGIGLKETLNNRIETEDDLKRNSNVPVLASIPFGKEKKHLVIEANSTEPIAETFRLLRSNIRFKLLNSPDKKVMLVTSSIPGEGKTFVSINLAMTFALKYKTLLVGLDIRKPKLGEYLGLPKQEGIVSYLYGDTEDIDGIILKSGINENLDIILAGSIPPNPNELLMEPTLEKIFSELRKRYDYIIVDTSPAGSVSDTFLIDRICDASIFVVRSEYTPKSSLNLANSIQEEGRLKNMEIVLNGVSDTSIKKYSYGYGYTYSYGYGEKKKK